MTKDAFNDAIAELLLARFNEIDYGRTRLARAVGMSRNGAYNYLDGTRPITVANLRKICIALGLDVNEVTAQAQRRIQ